MSAVPPSQCRGRIPNDVLNAPVALVQALFAHALGTAFADVVLLFMRHWIRRTVDIVTLLLPRERPG
jgi:hypothetical protein